CPIGLNSAQRKATMISLAADQLPAASATLDGSRRRWLNLPADACRILTKLRLRRQTGRNWNRRLAAAGQAGGIFAGQPAVMEAAIDYNRTLLCCCRLGTRCSRSISTRYDKAFFTV